MSFDNTHVDITGSPFLLTWVPASVEVILCEAEIAMYRCHDAKRPSYLSRYKFVEELYSCLRTRFVNLRYDGSLLTAPKLRLVGDATSMDDRPRQATDRIRHHHSHIQPRCLRNTPRRQMHSGTTP